MCFFFFQVFQINCDSDSFYAKHMVTGRPAAPSLIFNVSFTTSNVQSLKVVSGGSLSIPVAKMQVLKFEQGAYSAVLLPASWIASSRVCQNSTDGDRFWNSLPSGQQYVPLTDTGVTYLYLSGGSTNLTQVQIAFPFLLPSVKFAAVSNLALDFPAGYSVVNMDVSKVMHRNSMVSIYFGGENMTRLSDGLQSKFFIGEVSSAKMFHFMSANLTVPRPIYLTLSFAAPIFFNQNRQSVIGSISAGGGIVGYALQNSNRFRDGALLFFNISGLSRKGFLSFRVFSLFSECFEKLPSVYMRISSNPCKNLIAISTQAAGWSKRLEMETGYGFCSSGPRLLKILI